MTLFFVVVFGLDWLHNGFIALGWLSLIDSPTQFKYTWQAVLALLIVNALIAAWTAIRLDVYATLAAEWVLLTILLSRQIKPTAEVVTIVVLLVLHPVVLLAAIALKRTRDREGRIRLEEEAQAVEG
jgi:hypothetical protein